MSRNKNGVLCYIKRDSAVHRLGAASKLIWLLLLAVTTVITYDTRVLLLLFGLCAFAFALSKIRPSDIKAELIFIGVLLLLNFGLTFAFAPEQGCAIYGTRHALFPLWGKYYLTTEQLFYSLNVFLKYFTLLPMALLFIVTTTPSELAAGLNAFGIPYRFCFSASLALRFIPDIQREYRKKSELLQSKSVALGRKVSPFKRIKNSADMLLPLISAQLLSMEQLCASMQRRGFGKNKKRTWYVHKNVTAPDFAVIATAFVLLLLAIYTIYQNNGRFYNPFG